MAEATEEKKIKQPIQMDEATKSYSRSSDGVPTEIDIRGRKFYPKEYKDEGFKGVVWRGKDEYGGDVAIKFTIHADYMERSYLEEAKSARDLAMRTICVFLGRRHSGSPGRMVEGRNSSSLWNIGLTEPPSAAFIEQARATPAFLLSYVRGMCGALGVLSAKGYRHDDLGQRMS